MIRLASRAQWTLHHWQPNSSLLSLPSLQTERAPASTWKSSTLTQGAGLAL
jgi:hypothetical protein